MVDFAASLVYAYFLVPLYWNVSSDAYIPHILGCKARVAGER